MHSEAEVVTYWVAEATNLSMSRPVLLEKTDYWWIAIQVPSSETGQVESGGKTFDFIDTVPRITFRQNYYGLCDPSAEIPTSCFILEEYDSGDESLRGSASVSVEENVLKLSFDLEWRGLTTRFGEPPQWLTRVTEGIHIAEVTR